MKIFSKKCTIYYRSFKGAPHRSGIFDTTRRFHVDHVIHKAFIRINMENTEDVAVSDEFKKKKKTKFQLFIFFAFIN